VTLGDTGLRATPLGLGSSYGLGADDVERAFERGINYLYWGTLRRSAFGEGIRRVTRGRREQAIVVVQSYSRIGRLVRPSLERALRQLHLEHADLLLLGMWNRVPPPRILDAALACVDAGLARHVMVSCHRRGTFARYVDDPRLSAIMVRYNAAHPGAERDVFPHLARRRPGVVAYTATCWGRLVDPACTPPGEPTPRGSDCYRFALTNPNVHACMAGPKDRAELDEALAALDEGPMSPDEIEWMKRVGVCSARRDLRHAVTSTWQETG
jgi:aryl-alcohol dehydrogenase-like predicted oxidoreductase